MLNIVFKEFEKIAIKQVNGIENIICLDLNLDKGNLKYDLESTIREKYIENIYFIHYQYRDYVTNLQNIKCNLKKTKEIRIWCSPQAYSICGLYFICDIFKKYNGKLLVVNLPIYVKEKLVCSWSELSTNEIQTNLAYEKELTYADREKLANSWKAIQNDENETRLYINGEIISINNTILDLLLYDSIGNEQFNVSLTIRRLSNKYGACFDDYSYIAFFKRMVGQGKMQIVEYNKNWYKCVLQKSV